MVEDRQLRLIVESLRAPQVEFDDEIDFFTDEDVGVPLGRPNVWGSVTAAMRCFARSGVATRATRGQNAATVFTGASCITGLTGDTETRPKNISLLACIKI